MTGQQVLAPEPLSKAEAQGLVDDIITYGTALADRVQQLFYGRGWEALGYQSWESLCRSKFSGLWPSLSTSDRTDAVVALRELGMSQAAIGDALGVSGAAVGKRLANAPTPVETPAEVVGKDGKTYTVADHQTADRKPSAAEQRALAAKSDHAVKADPIEQKGIPVTEPMRIVEGTVLESAYADEDPNPYPHYGLHIVTVMDSEDDPTAHDKIDAALSIIKDLNTAIQRWKTEIPKIGAVK